MRKLTVMLAVATCAAAVWAKAKVETDHRSAIYRCGDVARFTVTVTDDKTGALLTNGTVNATVDNFGTNVVLKEKFDLRRGNPFTVKASRDTAGFLRLSLGGAAGGMWSIGFEPERIRPGAGRPADFDAFWAGAKKSLARVREDAKCELDPKQSTAQHNVYRISFATLGDRRVYGWLSVPKGPNDGLKKGAPAKAFEKYPVVVQVSAAGFGSWTVNPIRKPGWIGAFFAVYDFPPEVDYKPDVPKYEKLNADAKAKYGTDRYCTAGIGSSREECFFYPVWLGISRAVDWIARRPDVDPARFTYVGESQGGGSGFALCALNTHFTRAVFHVPALTDLLGFRDGGRQSGWPKMVESQATDEAKANAERFAPYFDAASFAPSITIPVRVLVGFSDPTCPAPCVYAAFNALGSRDKAIFDGLGDNHNSDSHGYRGLLEKWRQEIPPAASRWTPWRELPKVDPLLHHIAYPREAVNLAGEWEYVRHPHGKQAYTNEQKRATYRVVERPFDPASPSNAWAKCRLPSEWHLGDTEDVWVRRDFEVKDANRSCTIHFENVGSSFAAILNGKRVDGGCSYGIPRSLDLTGALKPGKNTLYVMFRKDGVRRQWSDSPAWQGEMVGVVQPFHLELTGRVRVEDVITYPRVVGGKMFRADVVVRNTDSVARKARVSLEVESQWSDLAAQEVEIPAGGERTVYFERPWDEAVCWSPDTPTLYFAKATVEGQDAFRRRFGFCEARISGGRILFNGNPVMVRRGGGVSNTQNKQDMFRSFARCRENGVTAARLWGPNRERVLDAADEFGFFITPVAEAGWGAAHRDQKTFWPVYERHLREFIRAFRHHPSVIYWCASNEFGTIYGGKEGTDEEEPATRRQQKAQMICYEDDIGRHRGWEACGEVEVGYPIKGSHGPAPVRSYHYPIAYAVDGAEMPEAAYWYDDGHLLPWQRIATHDKPTSISEDIFHGTMDAHRCLARFANDSMYTKEGYLAGWRWFTRTVAEGLYAGGITTWEPWCVSAEAPNNLLDRGFGIMPDYLFALRDYNRSLWSGEEESRLAYVYNQNFRPLEVTPEIRADYRDEALVLPSAALTLVPGCKEPFTVRLPGVEAKLPEKLTVHVRLRNNGWQMGERYARDYVFNVMPRVRRFDGGADCALVAPAGSMLRARGNWTKGAYGTAQEAIASGAGRIVVESALDDAQGRAIEAFVERGGKVLMLERTSEAWAPAEMEFKRPVSFAYRRDDAKLAALDDSMLACWRGGTTLGDGSYVKGAEDTEVLVDCAHKDGLTHFMVGWLYRREGAYLLCQLPVVSKLDLEPCAGWTLKTVLEEFATGGKNPTARAAVVDAPGLRKFLDSKQVLTVDDPSDAAVVLAWANPSNGLSAAASAAVDRALAKGRTAFVFGVTTNMAPYLARFGVEAYMPLVTNPKGNYHDSYGIRWSCRKDNRGLLRGVTNDMLFWLKDGDVWPWGMWAYGVRNRDGFWGAYKPGEGKMMEGAWCGLRAAEGSRAEIRTIPGTIAEARLGEGRIVLVSAKIPENAEKYPGTICTLIRTLLNNCGVRTSEPPELRVCETVDISASMNRNLWNDPKYQKADGTFDPVGWFGGENDFRFFPVNLCGWSIFARNYCPREPFPTKPMRFGPVNFQLTDPERNNGRGCIVFGTNETAEIVFKEPVTCRRFWFLGASSQGRTQAEFRVGDSDAVVETWRDGEQYSSCRWCGATTKGYLGWMGYTLKDPSASLFTWSAANPDPSKPVSRIRITNVPVPKNRWPGQIVIVGVTIEK